MPLPPGSDREPGSETIRFPLLLTVAFGRHLTAERLATFLADQRPSMRSGSPGTSNIGPRPTLNPDSMDAFSLATLDFGLAYERALLAWFEGLPAELTDRNWPGA